MFAPKWARGTHNLARFPSRDPCITPGYWAWYLNVLPTSDSLFRSLFYAFMPREGIYTCVFAPPPPLSDENPVMLHFFAYAEIIFAHILVFPACAIEVQHINENSPTIYLSTVFSTFDMDKSGKIHRNHWKKPLKNNKITKLESDLLKTLKIYSSLKSQNFTDACTVGAQTCPPRDTTKVFKFSKLSRSYIFAQSKHITW